MFPRSPKPRSAFSSSSPSSSTWPSSPSSTWSSSPSLCCSRLRKSMTAMTRRSRRRRKWWRIPAPSMMSTGWSLWALLVNHSNEKYDGNYSNEKHGGIFFPQRCTPNGDSNGHPGHRRHPWCDFPGALFSHSTQGNQTMLTHGMAWVQICRMAKFNSSDPEPWHWVISPCRCSHKRLPTVQTLTRWSRRPATTTRSWRRSTWTTSSTSWTRRFFVFLFCQVHLGREVVELVQVSRGELERGIPLRRQLQPHRPNL